MVREPRWLFSSKHSDSSGIEPALYSDPNNMTSLHQHGVTGYLLNYGQRFITESLGTSFIEVLAENVDSLNNIDDPVSHEILLSIKDSGELNFNISSHEEFFCLGLKRPEDILKYLTFRRKFGLAGLKRRLFDIPPYILVEPVSACNLRCPMCFQIDKTFTRKPFMGRMKWELFTKVVDEADEIGVGAVTVASRGEPMMHPRYGEMLSYIGAKKNIFELKTNTNATYLTEKICHEIFRAGVTTLVISADHYRKEDYEKLRKGADFEEVVANVAMLHRIRNETYPDCKTEIRVSGVDYYQTLDKKQFADFWSKYSDTVSSGTAIEKWDTYNNKPQPELQSSCSFLWDRMYVWFDGACNPCDADYKSYLSFGNVTDKTIKEVWNGSPLRELRQKHMNKKRNSLIPCDRCGIDFPE